jgi:hypothetical protein
VVDDLTRAGIRAAKMNTFFSSLDFITISEFVKDGKYNAQKYGLDKPVLVVELFNNDQKVVEMKLGKTLDTNIYATTNQYDSVYLIPAIKLDQLKLKKNEILEPVESTPGL